MIFSCTIFIIEFIIKVKIKCILGYISYKNQNIYTITINYIYRNIIIRFFYFVIDKKYLVYNIN